LRPGGRKHRCHTEETEALLDAIKEVGLEMNTKNTNKLMSPYENIGKGHKIKLGNRSLEGVAKFKCLGKTLTEINCMHEKIKRRLN
jgi:hypothetical protein